MSITAVVLDLLRDTTIRFTHAEVVSITGVYGPVLQNWVNRRLLVPAVNAPGKQGKRLYSLSDLLNVKIASTLIQLGVQAKHAFHIAERAVAESIKYIMDRADIDHQNKTILLPEIDIQRVMTVVHTTSRDVTTTTTFRDTDVPAEIAMQKNPYLIINTGYQIVSLTAKLHLHFKQRQHDQANADPSSPTAGG